MIYCVFRRKKDGRLVSGTDFRYHPYHQIYADENRPPLLLSQIMLDSEIAKRRINLKTHDIVEASVWVMVDE